MIITDAGTVRAHPPEGDLAVHFRRALGLAFVLVAAGCRPSIHSIPDATPVGSGDAARPNDITHVDLEGRQLDCPIVMRLVQHDPEAEQVDFPRAIGSACVELAQPGLPDVLVVIGCARVAEPYFAEPIRLEADLCTDDGSTSLELRAACIGEKGALVHVQARREGDAIAVSVDGQPKGRFGPNACIAAGAYRFVVPDVVPRFDAIRRSWGRREPSARCATFHGPPRTIDVVVRESTPARIDGVENQRCGENGSDRSLLELSIPSLGLRRELGPFGNGCGSYWVIEETDINRVSLARSNMVSSSRFIYPMGDRLVYLTPQNATETLDLPCGAQPRFHVFARGERLKDPHSR